MEEGGSYLGEGERENILSSMVVPILFRNFIFSFFFNDECFLTFVSLTFNNKKEKKKVQRLQTYILKSSRIKRIVNA